MALLILLTGCAAKSDDPAVSGEPVVATEEISVGLPTDFPSDELLNDKLKDMIALSDSSQADPNTVKVGQAMRVSLHENPSIPYRWKAYLSDEKVVAIVDDEYKTSHASDMPGGSYGYHHFYLEALAVGECRIEMRNEHVGDDEYFETYTYVVIVE